MSCRGLSSVAANAIAIHANYEPVAECSSLEPNQLSSPLRGMQYFTDHFDESEARTEARRMTRHALPVGILFLSLLFLPGKRLVAQGVAVPGDKCKPVSERTEELGCWILADDSVGQLTQAQVFWHLDNYPTRTAAQADKGPQGVVVESFGKVWLMTISDEKWRSAHGNRVAEIGPLPITAGETYSAQLMEAVFTPGMTAPAHIHSGPEAWYALGGETCLETSDGRMQIGRAGGPAVIAPAGLAMALTATGSEQRRSIVLILHRSSEPATTMIHDWTPKGLCGNKN
jgi:quercetin dioxygenase-like cupin family protein